ncbi:MAG TPA: Rid family hydrolase [Gemmatimonadaceae bacterium]|jgi:reactive intermediate/imine deaminase|nr:Rid family hydrolase [Gemmatimonadaceae bacterium]
MHAHRRAALALLTCLLAPACVSARVSRDASAPAPAPAPVYAESRPGAMFSPAVRAGGLLFLSGKLGTDSTGKLVAGGVRAETRQALTNIQAELERNGSRMDRVVKCTVLLADIAEWGAMNEAYGPFFPTSKPARTAVAVKGIPLDARVEIECIAA